MQTFLPLPNAIDSFRVLDNKRLGKQRSEALIIYRTLRGDYSGWAAHPAVKMWCNYEDALAIYYNCCIGEWLRRGFKNHMEPLFFNVNCADPPWMGDEAFHASHRAALLTKDPEWYGQFGWTEEPKIAYIWPTGE